MKSGIEMNRRFLRSVNLGRDRKAKDGLAGYVITPSVRNALARLKAAFTEDVTERAFTLTGPYGTGKSSFGLFLWHLLSEKKDLAWKMLQDVDAPLAESLKQAVWNRKGTKGCLVLTLTARCAPVAELLADAFESAELKYSDALLRDINSLRASRDTKQSMRLVQSCVARLCKDGYNGVFFVFDELGKVFEEARRESGKVDVFLLQELAEAASRSSETPMYFLGMLHQSFADYAAQETTLRNEFSKIEGRFEPISFIEPVAAQIHLAAAAFPDRNPFAQNASALKLIKGQVEDVKLASLVGLKTSEFAGYAKRALPIHPLSLAALPLLFRRFGQNERSIFSFLTSNEFKGFQDFLKTSEEGALFRLCDLFDYFFENYEAQLASRSFGQPFMEAHAAIQSKASLSSRQVEVLKTVAVLTSLGLQSPIHATESMISVAMAPGVLGDDLAQLKSQSILVYRKFNKTYALWNGSDIDLHECCEEADAELAKEHFSVAETFRKFLPPTPIVAKRHSVARGSLRYFDMVYLDNPDEVKMIKPAAKTTAAGTVVVCLTALPKWRSWFEGEAEKASAQNPSLVFAIPSDIAGLTDALLEIRRLNWVEANVKELRDDRIARREVAVRLAAATQSVVQHQFGILDPRPANQGGGGCRYVRGGQRQPIHSAREVSVMLSDVCDELYAKAPVIKNELVNKRLPSSQAAAARRVIINAMNTPDKVLVERLGIEGYPPERSIYESVIAQSGIHVKSGDGYVLREPSKNAATNLLPVWRRIEELVYAPVKDPLNVRELYDQLSKPPYGVLEGLMPILLTAFYVVNRDEVSLYSEGTFLPEPLEAHFELMLRRPELFSISGMRVKGVRSDIVRRLADGLQTEAKVLPVVRRLYAMMNSLTKYAKETNDVSEQAQNFRRAFFDAKSPEKLLFTAVPEALGLGEIGERAATPGLYESFFKKLNASLHELATALPKLVAANRKILLEACGYEATPDGWKALYDKASFLLARIGGSDICPFLQNVVNTAGDWEKADAVMSYVQQMPIAKWGTIQINEFRKNAVGIGERFRAAARPYEFVPSNLTSSERKAADSLRSNFAAMARNTKPAVLRAALIAYLEELQGK